MLREYSGGMRRRLDLAAGLVTHPPVLFLDEPTTGLDPTSRARMWGVIRELVGDGATVLLTTQYLDEADELADRILVVDHGRAIAEGTAAELKAQTGGARLEVTLSDSRPAAPRRRSSRSSRGRVHVSHDGRRLRAPVDGATGLATTVVRALDAAGIAVDDVQVHQPSLDDVFFALTGHPAERRRPGSRRNHDRRRGSPTAISGAVPFLCASPAGRLSDVAVLTGRNLVHIAREPLQLSDVTIQPVLFTVLFVYVFGAGVSLPGGSYKAFAIAGLLALNLTTSSMGTAVGLSTDLNSGVIDRFRTLPMWRPAVLVGPLACRPAHRGPLLADRGAHGPRHRLAASTAASARRSPASRLFLLFSYAMSWGCACLGIVSKGPESAQGVGLVILFPLAFVSNSLVPTEHMPAVLRFVADWNPVSAVTAAARQLFQNPNPSAAINDWPMQHPLAASLAWSIAMLVIFAPLAAHLYRRRTTD